jgi:hypothetical protein
MSREDERRTPWVFWPFVALWRGLTLILEMTGRLVAVILGLLLMVAGGLLTATVVGAPLGIPLALFGFLLLLRGLF